MVKASNRLLRKTREAYRNKRKLLCAYITLGYTNLSVTRKLLLGLARAGVDILELGFPFSDPLADGPTIQHASERALRHHITVDVACRMVAAARKSGVEIPILFFSYVNPILQYGARRFSRRIKSAGFDGVIVPDLPPDEDPSFVRQMERAGLCHVHLAAPTSSERRMKFLAARSDGFVYYVSRRGVTGERRAFEKGLAPQVNRLRAFSHKPVLIGFGVSTPAQARTASRIADGVVVGSAFISALGRAGGKTEAVINLARRFSRAVHGDDHTRR